MSTLIESLERLWCAHVHDATMWPIHGRYRCATCLREYPVPYASPGSSRLDSSMAGEEIRILPISAQS